MKRIIMNSHAACIVFLLSIASNIQLSSGVQYVQYCALNSKTVDVEWDAGLGKFFKSEKNNGSKQMDQVQDQDQGQGQVGGERERIIGGRNLRSSSSSSSTSSSSDQHQHQHQYQQKLQPTVFKAKECSCATNHRSEDTYCLIMNNENVCKVPTSKDYPVQCYRNTPAYVFTRNAWPVAILWIAAMGVYMVSTEGGRLGVKYALTKVLCCCNSSNGGGNNAANAAGGNNNDGGGNTSEANNDNNRGTRRNGIFARLTNSSLIDEILRREADARRRFQRAAIDRMGRRREHSTDPITYILKTTEYKKNKSIGMTAEADANVIANSSPTIDVNGDVDDANDDNNQIPTSPGEQTLPMTPDSTRSFDSGPDQSGSVSSDGFDDNDEITCTICIMEIEEGDRIGVLPCEHKFHVDCLKEWIKRKNTCPLCQVPNIAREKGSNSDDGSGNGNENGTSDGTNDAGGANGDPRMVRTTGIQQEEGRRRGQRNRNSVRWTNRRRRRLPNGSQGVQRDLFHVNSGHVRGRRGGGSVRQILVGDPGARIRVSTRRTATTAAAAVPWQSQQGGNTNGIGNGETVAERRERLHQMRRNFNP